MVLRLACLMTMGHYSLCGWVRQNSYYSELNRKKEKKTDMDCSIISYYLITYFKCFKCLNVKKNICNLYI